MKPLVAVRHWLGNGFCQTLLPTPPILEASLRTLEASGSAPTLVLPPLTDEGIRRLDALLPVLRPWETSAEVVVNDWGAAQMVARAGFTPVLGRLLTRILRDPRLPLQPESVPTVVGVSSGEASPYARLLQGFGIRWVEVDFVPQAAQIPYGALGVRPVLPLPYTFVATGRVCPFAGIHQPRALKFSMPPLCRQECRRYSAELDGPESKGFRAPMLSVGNTIFTRVGETAIQSALQWIDALNARVVVRNSPFEDPGLEFVNPQDVTAWLSKASPVVQEIVV